MYFCTYICFGHFLYILKYISKCILKYIFLQYWNEKQCKRMKQIKTSQLKNNSRTQTEFNLFIPTRSPETHVGSDHLCVIKLFSLLRWS